MPPGIPDLRTELSFFATLPEGRSYLIRVPGVAQAPISDAATARVLNWIIGKFASETVQEQGRIAPFTPAEVATHRANVLSDPLKLREKLLNDRAEAERDQALQALGRLLFFDPQLSSDGTQSCATCHDPAAAFSDSRDNGVAGAASLGSGGSLGSRNAPALTYASLIPERHRNTAGEVVGGYFWDGRAINLEQQALGPLLNPLEMALQDEAELAARITSNVEYQRRFKALFGAAIATDPQRLAIAVTEALAAFQRSEAFATFDSRYDRYLRGEYQPTRQELVGMDLFFSRDFTNCSLCHQLQALPQKPGEIFTSHRFENIGVPANPLLQDARRSTADTVSGLIVTTKDNGDAGRFRVPTLRNVAVTAPYMRNGVFKELRTVLDFYNHYNTTGPAGEINPESAREWGEPEIAHGLALDRLSGQAPLSEPQLDAMLAFLHMLTDERYENPENVHSQRLRR
jgi:cytochrome c peroxidase